MSHSSARGFESESCNRYFFSDSMLFFSILKSRISEIQSQVIKIHSSDRVELVFKSDQSYVKHNWQGLCSKFSLCFPRSRYLHLSWFLAAKEHQDRVCAWTVTSGIHTDFKEIMFDFCKSIVIKNSAHMEIFQYMAANSTDNNWDTSWLKSVRMAALVTSGSKGATEWNEDKTKKRM